MTPKEKAFELTEKFFHLRSDKMSDYSKIYWPTAKMCALVAVDEILSALDGNTPGYVQLDCEETFVFFKDVKQEIEKL